MKKLMKMAVLMMMVLALLLPQMACAEAADVVQGIFEALTAEGSDYVNDKAMYLESDPGIQFEETLENDAFTISVSGSEYMSGSWTFVKEGDYLTLTAQEEDFTATMIALYVLRAAGRYYGTNTSLLTTYIYGLEALGMDNPVFKREIDETAGTLKISISIAGPFEMKELDEMVLTEEVLNLYDYEPLTEEYTSRVANLGKVSAVVNGSRDGATFLLLEYGALDGIAYQDLINLVTALQPAGWEAFIADYTELANTETEEYTVALNVDEEAVLEIISDPPEGCSALIARFGSEIPNRESEEKIAVEPDGDAGQTDMQYVLYLGTNDKDTNTPVFTQAEAMERAKAILLSHFGGYTIMEAHGGWIDDGKEYQEYTLVIYLSDTTLDQVHAAADELVEVFHQSAVLIQENPTRTEFYGGSN